MRPTLASVWVAAWVILIGTLADAPGHGRVRRLIVLDLEEYARWHGKAE